MREGLRNEDYVAVIATAGPADRVGSSAPPEPLGKHRVEKVRLAPGIALHVTTIGEQPVERLLKSRARHPMLACHDSPRGSLAVADGEQHQPLVPIEAVPQCLVGIAGLFERQLDRRRRGVVWTVRAIEQVVEVMREQDGALWVPACEDEQFIHRTGRVQVVGKQQVFYVTTCS